MFNLRYRDHTLNLDSPWTQSKDGTKKTLTWSIDGPKAHPILKDTNKGLLIHLYLI